MKRYELLVSVARGELLPPNPIKLEDLQIFLDNVWVMLDEACKRYNSRTLKLSRTYLCKTLNTIAELK